MGLAEGTRLGAYEIVAPLGAGGMGEVYRARDTRLGRMVAVKISAEQFSARFERESRVISALNHPHICTLFDVGPNYLVMELVEGETLAARLRQGRLPIQQASEYGAQIADALAAAHARGIVHRDLKPANIMITRHGVKVLDFGLAKLTGGDSPANDETITASRALVGTPAYMAPEQLECKGADARTDIFALGVVLYEMAAGKRPFSGVLRGELAVPPDVPARYMHTLERCLEKDPAQRWQAAWDVKLELEWPEPVTAQMAPRRTVSGWLIGIALALLIAMVTAVALWRPRGAGREGVVYRFDLAPPPDTEFLYAPNRTGLALSPDGRGLTFLGVRNGQSRLWIQSLESQSARELPGTEDASEPFWSPDGRSLGFFAAGSLKRIDADGGNLQVLAEIRAPRGGTWGPNGILFAPSNTVNSVIYRIPASGGKPEPVTPPDQEVDSYESWPAFLPDGKRFLHLRTKLGSISGIYLGSLDDRGMLTRLAQIPPWFRLAQAGPGGPLCLLWHRDGMLVAQPLAGRSLHLSGEPTTLIGPVGVLSNSAFFAVSNTGLLVFGGTGGLEAQWVDRGGKPLGVVGEPGSLSCPRQSPDGSKVAVALAKDFLIIDIARHVTSRMNSDLNHNLAWSPDSRKLAFLRDGKVTVMNSDSGQAETTVASSPGGQVCNWTPDGRAVLYSALADDGRHKIWMAEIASARSAHKLLGSAYDEVRAAISPDGHWLAAVTDESGRYEVYVQRLDGGAQQRIQVSSSGGDFPQWRADGKELFYVARDHELMSVGVKQSAGTLEFQAPQRLFPLPASYVSSYVYDAAADGQRFLVLAPYRRQAREPLHVVVNWPALLGKSAQ